MRTPLAILAAGCIALAGCQERHEYSAQTPEEALDAARAMLRNGEPERLVTLIHAENERMRSLINQSGRLLAALKDLSDVVHASFPGELAAIEERARIAAEEGRASSLLERLVGSRSAGAGGGFGAAGIEREDLRLDTGAAARPAGPDPFAGFDEQRGRRVFNAVMQELLADPFKWLDEERSKLSTQYVADDRVALLWEERPILPPFGLLMVEEEIGGETVWQLVLPTRYPFVSRLMPRTEDEYLVFGSILVTIQRVVEDLAAAVERGEVRDLTDLADTAVEMAALPAVMVIYAYSTLMEERGKAAPASEPATAP